MSLVDDYVEFQRVMQIVRDGQGTGSEFDQLRETLRTRYERLEPEDAAWLLDRLAEGNWDWGARTFVGMVLEFAHGLPQSFCLPLIRAAVYETDPSFNRYFVAPAVRDFGTETVAEQLLRFLNDGTNFEKGGAANAFYWMGVASRRPTDSSADLWRRIRDKFLTEFVSNDDTQVRRCIIAKLSTNEADYSPNVRSLVQVAVEIARNHSDGYIRHRIEVQLGNESLLQALPHRTRPQDA